jgi:hypothetical protein
MAEVRADGLSVLARVYNISPGGALLSPVAGLSCGMACQVRLPGYGSVTARVVRTTADSMGIAFDAVEGEGAGDPDQVFHRVRHGQIRRG